MTGSKVFAYLACVVLFAGCQDSAKKPSRTVRASSSTAVGSSSEVKYPTKIGSDVDAATVWPIPPRAIRGEHGVFSMTVREGSGDMPRLKADHVLGIATVTYDKEGRVVSAVPFRVQAVDLAHPTWQDVFLRMKAGEVRRAWIPMPNGDVAIMDFELQRLVIPTPADYATATTR